MTLNAFKAMVLAKTGGGIYREGDQDGQQINNTSCMHCGSDIYLSQKPSRQNNKIYYKYCSCDRHEE